VRARECACVPSCVGWSYHSVRDDVIIVSRSRSGFVYRRESVWVLELV